MEGIREAGMGAGPSTMREMLDQLGRARDFMRNVTYWHHGSAQPARYAPLPIGLDPRLIDALEKRGITHLYTHQAEAIREALAGRDVVVVTPTASGKTLCYNLPVLQMVLSNPAGRALYLFPTKALAQDQLAEVQSMLSLLGEGPIAGTYDGDTPASARPKIRRQTRIVISNPDMLHMGVLPHHTGWAEFFSHLQYVVIDELHAYRGVFGSHVANVLRRLRRVAAFYGSQPRFICCSATIANPRELAAALTESPVRLVDDDGSPKGEKHLIFYNPPVVNRDLGIRRSVILEARDIAGRFLAADVQTIVFARARLATEVLLTYLREYLQRMGRAADSVRGYRGGYLPMERREIERGLREGSVRGVVATNALELGIDIGNLSAAVLAGYPGSIASTWQQAGRAGRRADLAAAVFVASASPLDQYIVNHPSYFFGRSPEQALIAPDNLAILLPHLKSAAFELPFGMDEPLGRFDATAQVLRFLEEQETVRLSAGRWHWMSESFPARDVSLRTAGVDNFAIMAVGGEAEKPVTIGQLDRLSVPLLLHEGAIYIHEGQSFLVDTLDWEGAMATVRPVEVDYYTDASVSTDIELTEVLAQTGEGRLEKGLGNVAVRSRATGYKVVKLYTHEILGRGPIDLPEQSMPTVAFWYAFPESLVDALREAGLWQGEPLGDYGPNWDEQRRLARERDRFRCRHCDTPEPAGGAYHVHHVRPFREFDYRPGQNDNYRAANDLSNLMTLCAGCHRLVEMARQLRSTLAGLAHVLRHVAPLYVMCDPRDLGVVSKSSGVDGQPTVYVYDRTPAGLGFSQALYELEPGVLLRGVSDLIRDCRCTAGCPSCVGPAGELSGDVKGQVRRVIEAALRGGE